MSTTELTPHLSVAAKAAPARAASPIADACLRGRKFPADEAGAVTVDWVVLTAAIVALGFMVFVPVFSGSSGVANTIAADIVTAVNK